MRIKYWTLFLLSFLTWQCAFAVEKLITLEEIKSHNTAKNCWIIVDTKVYDITKFIEAHDMKCGTMKLTDFCGKDASTIWQEKQKSNDAHKRKSVLEFERSQIGTLIKP